MNYSKYIFENIIKNIKVNNITKGENIWVLLQTKLIKCNLALMLVLNVLRLVMNVLMLV
ncbi:hypothetical protein [Sedimentibacter saalensis]|jgi:hypothetical protein|uniref:hypothetical protein n=1 Tax=Sedimentibacter saalensis TaxID=130788 RepID=UPI001FE33A9F|nr:hypothetical protein [Sedimentibacter saalensis]